MPGKITGIVLAAGQGRRMGSDIPKQFIKVGGRMLICYSLEAFEKSCVDNVILVAGADKIGLCREQIVGGGGFKKVSVVIAGGDSRTASVYNALRVVGDADVVLIHDGARPCVTPQIIDDVAHSAALYGSATSGVPAKNTIKTANTDAFAVDTPDRSTLWEIHTPQGFLFPDILRAHRMYAEDPDSPVVTDDTVIAERYLGVRTKLVAGSYKNIKVTTPEDLMCAAVYLGIKP